MPFPAHTPAPSTHAELRKTPGDTTTIDNASIRVLVAHRDAAWLAAVATYLRRRQLCVACVTDGPALLDNPLCDSADVVVLGMDLPNLSGAELCRRLRLRRDTPVVAVVDGGDEVDRVLALESGADDCVTQEISLRELLARIRAQVRRARGCLTPCIRPVQVGALHLDPRSMRATLEGRPLQLTSYEFGLLHHLAERAGQVLSRERLLELVRGRNDDAFDRSVDVHISRLRQKLGDDPRCPRLLKTVRGAGYLIGLPEDPGADVAATA